MINYSIVMRRKNVADKESEKLAYAIAQYNSVITILTAIATSLGVQSCM